jgi:hypothetical protein
MTASQDFDIQLAVLRLHLLIQNQALESRMTALKEAMLKTTRSTMQNSTQIGKP